MLGMMRDLVQLHTTCILNQHSSLQLQHAIDRGFPSEYRGELWKKLLEIDTLRPWTNFDYQVHVIPSVIYSAHPLLKLGLNSITQNWIFFHIF